MRLNIKKAVGSPVYKIGDTESWGKITDVLFDKTGMRVSMLVVSTDSLVPLRKYIPLENVAFDGRRICANRSDASQAVPISELTSYSKELLGRRFGKVKINNMQYDIEAGEILDFTISRFGRKKRLTPNILDYTKGDENICEVLEKVLQQEL